MFVVRTVNQLEEAIRVGAKEILVNGKLAGRVKAAWQPNGRKDSGIVAAGEHEMRIDGDVHRISGMNGIPVWGGVSMLALAEGFTAIDAQGDLDIPSLILQQIHKD
jgi:hypothetical protein